MASSGPGVRVFAGNQKGWETTKGTAVAATYRMRNMVAFPVADSPLVYTQEDVAISGGTDRSHTPSKAAQIGWPKSTPSYQEEPHFLSMGIKSLLTGVADAGAGASGSIYDFPLPTDAAHDVKTATVEAYDDYQGYESEDVFVVEYNLAGKINEAWSREVKAIGRQVTKAAKTAALTLLDVNDILFQDTKLYLDPVAGAMGATVKANSFLGFEIKLLTGWKAQPTGDGNLWWSFPKYVGYKLTGKLLFEHDAIGVAQFDAFNASPKTPQLMRIRALGPALTTPGTAYSYLTASIDAPIKYTKASEIKDEGGNDVIEMEWESKYNVTAARAANFVFVNQNATLV